MSNLAKSIITVGIALVLSIGASAVITYHYESKTAPQLGATSNFNVVEGVPYTVAQTVLPTDTTITLSSFNSPSGLPFTMANFGSIGYATLDPTNLSRLETVTFTGITSGANNTVVLTGVTRGLDFVSPYAASSTLARIHLVGSNLILSNPAAFYGQQFAFVNATTTINAKWVFSSTTAPSYDFDPGATYFTAAASSTLIDQAQLNRAILSGCTNATLILNGCVQLATQIQSASSTGIGSSGANLVPSNLYATSSPGSAGLWDVWTDNAGKIAATFLNGTEQYIFNGLSTFNSGFIDNASSTITSSLNISGTLNLNGNPIATKFGGTGTNGALTISSGTTTISLASAAYVELDYTSISITGTGALAFSSPNTNGTFIVIRSQGNVTLTCGGDCIYAVGDGSAGGAAVSGSNAAGNAGSAGNAFYLFKTSGGSGGNTTSTGGATPTAIVPSSLYVTATSTLQKYGGQFWVGAGGGSGACSGGSGCAGGAGGAGGGGVLLEVGGALNLTAANAINVSGVAGSNNTCVTSTATGLGGGGGGGGLAEVVYNTLTANTGSLTVAGGAGGLTGPSNCGTSGSNQYGGGGGGTAYTAGSAGNNTTTNGALSGGAGANGNSIVIQNNNFF